ncbi:hypothetical protein [Microbacterium enclense]|uniref:DUF4062 domain-containing protein n=1 Tax=Microbacterium enclense TaxID=993073 RepID=A0A1G6HLU6_9MICO|nr:hypothetical protein [Microbacterium enclense]KSU55457.1 hypothetical protein AS029_05445 [Microbacterium enclense]SDB95277.1 hypothetical protein SAMN05216418_1339 [Microbacterium enclense]
MAFTATVLSVMIASPSDTADARDSVEKALQSWNDTNSRNRGVVLLPWRWETNAVPVLGGPPQALINSQGLDSADIVFALFGSRLGSPTTESVSGTVEEIEGATSRDVPVHLYFSTAPLPHDVEVRQIEGLRDFKAEIQARGLYGEYANPTELTVKVWQSVEHDLASLHLLSPSTEVDTPGGITWLVQPRRESYVNYNLRGVPSSGTRNWLEITNRHATKDAEEVRFSMNEEDAGVLLSAPEEAVTVHSGQTKQLGLQYMLGGAGSPKVTIRWVESGKQKEQTFFI